MNRIRLEQAVERLAVERGWHFLALRQQAAPTLVRAYPAALLHPLSLRSIEGRNNGRAVYDLSLVLMRTAARAAPSEQAQIAAQLEEELLEILSDLTEEECVLAIEELQIEPSAATLTPHGEIAQTARARIVTWF